MAMKSPSPNTSVTKEVENILVDSSGPDTNGVEYKGDEPSGKKEVEFELSSEDGRSWKSHDLEELWRSVVGELQEARSRLDLPFIPYCG